MLTLSQYDRSEKIYAAWINTDKEPDDEVALRHLCIHLAERIQGIGVSILNVPLKAYLLEQELKSLHLTHIRIAKGAGGSESSYPSDIEGIVPARTYADLGKGAIDEGLRTSLNLQPRDSLEAQTAIRELLEQAKDHSIDFFELAPHTDLAAVLQQHADLCTKIRKIWMMGGWREVINQDSGTQEKRSTYNWNMDRLAAKELLAFGDRISIVLFSSHRIKEDISQGSIQPRTFPTYFDEYKKTGPSLPYYNDFQQHVTSWNQHLIKNFPEIGKSIEDPAIDFQFTPADVITVAGALQDTLSEAVHGSLSQVPANLRPLCTVDPEGIRIDIDLENKTSAGYLVHVHPDPESKIRLAGNMNSAAFEETLITTLNLTAEKWASGLPL